MHHGSRKLRYKFPLSSRTPPLHSGDRMLHFAPDSRLTLQLFRNAIIVTRCLELRKPSPLSSPVLSRAYASPLTRITFEIAQRLTSTYTRDSYVYVYNIISKSRNTDVGFLRKIFFRSQFSRRSFTRLNCFLDSIFESIILAFDGLYGWVKNGRGNASG